MTIQTVGLMSPGDMGHSIGNVLRLGGLRVITCLRDRSARTAALAAQAGIQDVPDYETLVRESDVLLSVLAPSEAGRLAERVAAEVDAPGVHIVHNADAGQGMLSSVLRGLDAAQEMEADAILLHPVDHPLVEPDTVDRVVQALAAGALIAVPSHEGRRGHPGGFARATWPDLRAAPAQRGARAVLHAHPAWIVHVPGGPGSVTGINTPADLERLL